MIIVEFESGMPILAETKRLLPEVELSVESRDGFIDDEGEGQVRLLLWARGADCEAVLEGMQSDSTVADVRLLEDLGNRCLFRVLYSDEAMELTSYHKWVELDASMLYAERTRDGWFLRMRFPDRAAVREYLSSFEDHGIALEPVGIYTATEESDLTPVLTDRQRETLRGAWEAGYFEVPREVSLVELSREFGISDTACSQRLRRGLDSVLDHYYGSGRA